MYKTINYVQDEGIGTIYLNRPESMNAMDMVMRVELRTVLGEIKNDDAVKAVIISGKGKAFCAGGDISTMRSEMKSGDGVKRLQYVHTVYQYIQSLGKPVIASINGVAAGSGLSLACACDFRIAGSNAKFATSFLNVGLVPDCGILHTLPRLLGLARAKEMLMLPSVISAEQAFNIGLVNKVVAQEELDNTVAEFARDLISRSPIALKFTKEIINKAYESDFDSLLRYEAYSQDICFASEEHKSAVKKFLDKNKKGIKED